MSERSSKDIERDIEKERSGLDDTLNELTGRFDADYVVRQIGTHLRDNGGEIGRSVQRAVKENPLALAVTGVGLGWLIFGQGRDRNDRVAHTDHAAQTPMRLDEPLHPAARTEPDWARPDPDEFVTPAEFDQDSGPGMRDRASGAARDAGQSVSDGARRMRDGASARAAATRARAERMQARLSRGTENMNAEARDRVVRARRQAMEARDSASRQARKGADRAADFFEEQPLVAGAIALAVGAALAGGLPRSRTEDRYLGEQSDALMDEAERIFREESEKAKKVAQAAGEEVQNVADEKRGQADETAPGDHSAASAARSEAEDAVRRVRDRAEDEADNQDLGNPRT
ncbi:DUF3618 domain-containing protein [Palleronia abyssalis]|uniref:DUF3618 domain-containing protein n=1 Tax=Palleronia abyssalis TaxID=1501240 RepID=A0A2R8C247_9RHOB|nr:DUF3618 domain-containing protein [Palleronia abyssalis]SPJ26473.1 hypothetical protein PAA8504_04335 [Palleronia abyssalis]